MQEQAGGIQWTPVLPEANGMFQVQVALITYEKAGSFLLTWSLLNIFNLEEQ